MDYIIPEKIVNFNIYNNKNPGKLLGITEEVELPEFENMSNTISGAGIMGEIESPTPGHFGSVQIEIPFRMYSEQAAELSAPGRQEITIRAAAESYVVTQGKKDQKPLKVVVAGSSSGNKAGKIAVGVGSEASVSIEVEYYKLELDGKVLLEIDKLNNIYVVNGIDYYKKIRDMI